MMHGLKKKLNDEGYNTLVDFQQRKE